MGKMILAGGLLLGLATAALGGTLTDGNASLVLLGNSAFPQTPVFNYPQGDAGLFTEPNSPDWLYKYTWYYRTQNNNQNTLFSYWDRPVDVVSGNTETLTYTQAGPGVVGNERFDATIVIKLLYGVAPAQARVLADVTFTASATNLDTRTYQVFNLIDLDVFGTATDDSAAIIDPLLVLVRQSDAASGNFAEAYGRNATKYEVGSASALRTKLSGGSFDLSNAVGPVAGDVAIAFQWTLTLAPGQTAHLHSEFALNGPGALCRGDVNCDGQVNFKDINPFVAALSGSTPCNFANADINADGAIDFKDINPFVGLLTTGGACP